jgi:hypothetical protein
MVLPPAMTAAGGGGGDEDEDGEGGGGGDGGEEAGSDDEKEKEEVERGGIDDEPAVDVTDDFPHETALERGDELVPNPLCNVLRAADLRYFKGLEPAGEEEEEEEEAEGFTRVVANLNYAGDSSNEALESSVRQVLLVPDALAEKMGDAEMDPPLTFGGERPELQWLHHFGVLVRKEEE